MKLTLLLKLGLSAAFLGLVACKAEAPTENSQPSVSNTDTVAKDTGEPEAFSPPTFADMVNLNKPLGVVSGNYKPLPYNLEPNTTLKPALDKFASESESYSVIVWQGGKIVYETYPAPHTKELRAESASMHKSVMSLLFGAAIDDGFIGGVDDKVAQYVPEWADDERGNITLRDLLEMSSGLKPFSSEGGMNSDSIQFVMNGNSARQSMLGMKLDAEPGTVFHYQNAVSLLLGQVIENASGKSYQDYLSERIWKPIGARDAKVWFNETDGFPRTYTGLYAVPRDWLRLGLLVKDNGLFNGNQIISKKYLTSMTAPSRVNPNYGWQIWRGANYEPARYYNDLKAGFGVLASEPFAVDDMIYFDGFGGQRVYISRSQDLVIIRTGNVLMTWDDSKLPNLVIPNL